MKKNTIKMKIISYFILIILTISFFYCSNNELLKEKLNEKKINIDFFYDTYESYENAIKKMNSIETTNDYDKAIYNSLLIHAHTKLALEIAAEYNDFKNNKLFLKNIKLAEKYLNENKKIMKHNSYNTNKIEFICELSEIIYNVNSFVIIQDKRFIDASTKLIKKWEMTKFYHPLKHYYFWRVLDYPNIKSKFLDKALENKYSEILARYDIANNYFYNANYLLASLNYNKILKLSPKHINSICGLSISYIYLKENNKAIELLKNSLKLDSTHSGINHNLGFAYYKAEQYKKAIKYLTKSFEQNTDKIHTIFLLSNSYLKIENYDKALFFIMLGLSKNPSYKTKKEFNDLKKTIQRLQNIKFSNTSGNKVTDPIIIKSSNNYEDALFAVDDYLTKKYGIQGIDWIYFKRKNVNKNNKIIEEVIIYIKSTKKKITIYFDLGSLF